MFLSVFISKMINALDVSNSSITAAVDDEILLSFSESSFLMNETRWLWSCTLSLTVIYHVGLSSSCLIYGVSWSSGASHEHRCSVLLWSSTTDHTAYIVIGSVDATLLLYTSTFQLLLTPLMLRECCFDLCIDFCHSYWWWHFFVRMLDEKTTFRYQKTTFRWQQTTRAINELCLLLGVNP